jgi:hypothetical protein
MILQSTLKAYSEKGCAKFKNMVYLVCGGAPKFWVSRQKRTTHPPRLYAKPWRVFLFPDCCGGHKASSYTTHINHQSNSG